ncbi:MAG: hypothetical protein ACD_2C00256G0009 [uncultured bacterium (gcode 4)]|uniref:Uncharacterized protein n=1 Tax=uncultured bacterium (gcode 4) TaxID=1234023 RepID=K2G3V4_9BACT|nr:MAG: hypothetical protein ACD_2C00256G0009 [uncultured bacterium (gcode 4)]
MAQILDFTTASALEKIEGGKAIEVNDKTLNEYVNEMMRVKAEVSKLISSSWLIKLTEFELLITLKNLIRNELISKGEISESMLPCCDYLWIIIHRFLMWNVAINQYTQDFLNQQKADYRCAGDINLIKYIFQYSKKRHNPMTWDDYMHLATTMYYHAYERWQLKLWYLLSYNLQRIDGIISLPWLPKRLFEAPLFAD